MTFSKKNLAFVQVQGHLIHFEIVQYLKRGHKWKRLKGYMTYGTIVIKTSPWRWTQASLHATYNINACLILRSQSKENE